MMATTTVTVRANTLLFRGWLQLLKVLLFCRLISGETGMALAQSGSWLVLVKVGHRGWGWHWLSPHP